MKKLAILPLLLASLLWISGCNPACRIYSEVERGINFSHFHTFKWTGKPVVEDAIQYVHINPITEEKIRVSAETQLARFAIEPCEDGPDLTVHYHVLTKNNAHTYNDWQCSDKFRRFQMKGYCESIESANLQDAMPIIDMVEEKTGNQIWRGAATGAFDGMNEQEIKRQIEEVVRRIFDKLPGKLLVVS